MKPRTANVVAKVVGWVTLAAILAVVLLVFGPFVFVFVVDDPDRAKWERARTDMGEIHKELSRYAVENDGQYPSQLEAVASELPGGKLPLDPWTNQPFGYETDGRSFRLICLGKDGKPGGSERHDLDIVYTENGLTQ